MTLHTNSFATYAAVGNKEDLSNVIYDISPTDTPVLSALPRVKATGTKHEWQTDALASAAANQQLEGDDVTADTATATTRLYNICQISYKVPSVTGTQEAVSKAGRKSEMAYQIQKRAKELKRDMETDICANNALVTGGATTARELGGLSAWIATNIDKDSSSTAGAAGTTAFSTSSTTRVFTEDLMLNALQSAFTNGGSPSLAITGAFNLNKVAGFSGGAVTNRDQTTQKVVNSVKVYVTPWGQTLKLMADRFSPAGYCYLLDPEYAAVAHLRPFKIEEIAKTGDAMTKMLVTEYTLEVRNEAAHGAVYDLTTS